MQQKYYDKKKLSRGCSLLNRHNLLILKNVPFGNKGKGNKKKVVKDSKKVEKPLLL